jgi:hypothetical protein
LLAEFWHIYREGPKGPEVSATCVSDGELIVSGADAVEEGMMQHLIVVGHSLHIVTNMTPLGPSEMKISVKPKMSSRGGVRCKSFGYIGSYIAELRALIELAEDPKPTNVLRSILDPRRDLPGDFAPMKPLAPGAAINQSQLATVKGLKYALEKIQGPPGTGKSTTIYHIITARVPRGARVLVTCSRNVAVESIAQKLEACTDDRMLVFGNATRIGPTARRYLLDAKCQRHPSVQGQVRCPATRSNFVSPHIQARLFAVFPSGPNPKVTLSQKSPFPMNETETILSTHFSNFPTRQIP